MIFKKHISIILTFFLLVSNLGLAFNVHYCGNKIESISLKIAPPHKVEIDECCGIVEIDSQCCMDKVIKSDVKSDQIIVKTLSFDSDFTAITEHWSSIDYCSNYILNPSDVFTYYCDANAPPLYLLYNQYTFYA
jgi:hypothetical protein